MAHRFFGKLLTSFGPDGNQTILISVNTNNNSSITVITTLVILADLNSYLIADNLSTIMTIRLIFSIRKKGTF